MPMLRRYRMLDLTRLVTGPFASHILADMGMDVIKVEEPEPRYGMARDSMTPYQPTPDGERRASAFNIVARNKKSIALDLLRPDLRPRSQEVFYRLAREADVVLEAYRPGVVKWMGIDYEMLHGINPRIIVCSISGYGQDGPYARYPGHGGQNSAVASAIGIGEDGQPERGVGAFTGFASGFYAVSAILGALLEREETGEGQHIDVSMMGAAMSLTLNQAARYFRDGTLSEPSTGRAEIDFLQCKDGKFISTGNAETVFWENFCKLIERPQYTPLSNARGVEFDGMVEDIKAVFLTKTRDEWLPLLWAAETAAAPVNNVAEAFVDPQVQHIGMAWELTHPTEGAARQIGWPVRFSRTPVGFERFAPILGEHTRELLDGAGFSAAEISALERDGIVKSWTGQTWVGGAAPSV
ncbi:MAG: CoA transferase [Dehalococcoidia bacterium]|nr:CoA transferase [Dehalococcoidia bacterium]